MDKNRHEFSIIPTPYLNHGVVQAWQQKEQIVCKKGERNHSTRPKKEAKVSSNEAIKKTAEDLENLSNALTHYSLELLSPPNTPKSTSLVTNTPTNMIIGNKPAPSQNLECVPETEEFNKNLSLGRECTVLEDNVKDELLKKLKEDIEVALVYSTTLKAKIEGIHESIASHEEVQSFNEGLKKRCET